MKTLSEKREQLFGKISGFANIYREEYVKEFIKKCFKRMERKLVYNQIKYQDVVLIIKEEAGEKLK